MNRNLILINQKIDYTKCIAISGHDIVACCLLPVAVFPFSPSDVVTKSKDVPYKVAISKIF
jgi:hypothetical protein